MNGIIFDKFNKVKLQTTPTIVYSTKKKEKQ